MTLATLRPAALVAICLGLTLFIMPEASAADKKCLFVSSYHQGYEWSDGVERGLRAVLEGKCEYRQFDMDTKRRKSAEEKKQSALEAKGITPVASGPEYIPTTMSELPEDKAKEVLQMVDALEQDDDVQQVFHNLG